jgi:hypothetical protein
MARTVGSRPEVSGDPEVLEGLAALDREPMRDLLAEQRKLSDAQIVDAILRILKERSPRTTLEIEAIMRRRDDCRDSMAKHLAKMRFRKLVTGALDGRHGTWVWALP